MDYQYGEFDGQPFPTPDSLFPSPRIMQFILQYGQQALDAMDQLDDDKGEQYNEAMIAAGLLERDADGTLRLTPKMVRGIQHKSLLEIFEGLKRGSREGHQTLSPGHSDERSDGTRPYQFGDPLSEIDHAATMRNALHRKHTDHEAHESHQRPGAVPICAEDFELHITEGQSDVAMCLLLDLSGSMIRYGRFYQAKRLALGMSELLRSRFPQDTLDFAGFYSTACRIRELDLPLVMPKPITVRDYEVRVRVPLEQAEADPDRIPQHFTNLQMGLRLARQMLNRRGAANKVIFIVTDGQPTAHVEPNPADGRDMLYLLYPPTEQTATITLKEALRCQQQGINLATFALIEDYWGMEWVSFVDQLTRLTRGIAYYCSSDNLASTVIESYLSGKKRKSFVS